MAAAFCLAAFLARSLILRGLFLILVCLCLAITLARLSLRRICSSSSFVWLSAGFGLCSSVELYEEDRRGAIARLASQFCDLTSKCDQRQAEGRGFESCIAGLSDRQSGRR